LKAMDLDLDSDLKVLPASPFFKSFVSTKYRSIRKLVFGLSQRVKCVSVVRPSVLYRYVGFYSSWDVSLGGLGGVAYCASRQSINAGGGVNKLSR